MPLKSNGVPTDAEIDATAARSAELFFNEVLDLIAEDPDPVGTAYGLFVHLARHLAEAGWTGEELARDAAHHANDQMADGRA